MLFKKVVYQIKGVLGVMHWCQKNFLKHFFTTLRINWNEKALKPVSLLCIQNQNRPIYKAHIAPKISRIMLRINEFIRTSISRSRVSLLHLLLQLQQQVKSSIVTKDLNRIKCVDTVFLFSSLSLLHFFRSIQIM